MTVCPKCNGRGTVGYFHIDHFVDIECDRCHGSGEVSETDVTNEEWFCNLSTEEKARFLEMICYSAWGDINSRFKDMADYKDWIEWLKEKHNEMS